MKFNKILSIILTAGLSFAALSCNSNEPNEPGKTPEEEPGEQQETGVDIPEKSAFRLAGTLPSEVNVTLDDVALYKYEFKYDDYKRLQSFKLTSGANVLQNITVTQNDTVKQTITGKYSNSQFSVSINVRWASGSLVWSYNDVDNPNRYVVNCDASNKPNKFFYNIAYKAPKYENNTTYSEVFTTEGSNVTSSTYKSAMTSTGISGLKGTSGPEYKMKISYTSNEDISNIGSFFIGEEFVVWYAKGLPANKNLISKIEYFCDNTTLARTDEFSYDIDSATKQVKSLTMKQYYNTKVEHTYVYTFKY